MCEARIEIGIAVAIAIGSFSLADIADCDSDFDPGSDFDVGRLSEQCIAGSDQSLDAYGLISGSSQRRESFCPTDPWLPKETKFSFRG